MKATQTCSIEGCERPRYGRGWCATHWARWRRNGDPLALQDRSAETRFHAKVDRNGPNGCWLWTAGRTPAGYGLHCVDGVNLMAHRYAYELLVRPLVEGDVIDHLCRNPPCVNPQHLDVVTNRVNVLRGMSPTAIVHRQRRCQRGHAIEGANVYVPAKYPTQRQCRECRNRSKRAYAARAYATRKAAG